MSTILINLDHYLPDYRCRSDFLKVVEYSHCLPVLLSCRLQVTLFFRKSTKNFLSTRIIKLFETLSALFLVVIAMH